MQKWLQEFLRWFRPDSVASPKASTTGTARKAAPEVDQRAPVIAAPAAARRAARRRPATMTVNVGLDFGTSVSKVMFSAGGSGIEPLDLQSGASGNPGFFVPSLITVAGGKRLLVGAAAQDHLQQEPDAGGLTRFKMLVAGVADPKFLDAQAWKRYRKSVRGWFGSADAVHPEVAASVFIADTMRRVRLSLEQRNLADELNIVFNTCVPIDQAEHRDVKNAFDRVAAVAQRLYEHFPLDHTPSMAWIDQAAALRETVRYEQDDATRLFVFPEAVASFATYKESLSRQEGIHALIDIGAGTTDVSILYLAIPKGTTAGTECWSARSVPMGMGMIEDDVLNELDGDGTPTVDQTELYALLRSGQHESRDVRPVLSRGLERIWNATLSTWAEAYRHYKGQERWSAKNVRIFLAGGGADVHQVRQTFSRSWQRGWGPYPTETLPTPDDLAGVPGLPFHRLSVAYGLSRPGPDLDVGILPSLARYYDRAPVSYRVDDPFDGPT